LGSARVWLRRCADSLRARKRDETIPALPTSWRDASAPVPLHGKNARPHGRGARLTARAKEKDMSRIHLALAVSTVGLMISGCMGQPLDGATEGQQAALETETTPSPLKTDNDKAGDQIVPFDYDEVTCFTPVFIPFTCKTRPIPSHRSQHWVRVRVGDGGLYTVTDLDTGHIVDRGSGTHDNWKTIPGLYGNRYQLFVSDYTESGLNIRGMIDNCTSGCRNN
jgi:hypothetical protein